MPKALLQNVTEIKVLHDSVVYNDCCLNDTVAKYTYRQEEMLFFHFDCHIIRDCDGRVSEWYDLH